MRNPVADNEEISKLCLCPACPTRKKSNFTLNFFVQEAKPKKKQQPQDAYAQTVVFKEYSLDQMYHCSWVLPEKSKQRY